MAAPSTAAGIALPILILAACLYHRATHPRPYSGIPCNHHSTRRLWRDIPELMPAAQRYRDPAEMTIAQFEKVGSQLFLMPFWRPLVHVSDMREVEDVLQNRLHELNGSPALVRPFKPIVPDSSLVKVRGPEIVREAACDADLLRCRVPEGAIVMCSTYVANKSWAFPDADRSATSRAETAYGAAEAGLRRGPFSPSFLPTMPPSTPSPPLSPSQDQDQASD